MARYGIPRERVLYSRDLSFAGEVRRLTAGRGVDVVLNSLAGDALVVSWECVAPFGRFVEIGKRDIFSHGRLPMYQFAKNVSFCAVDLRAVSVDRPEVIKEVLGEVLGVFERGVLRLPEPVRVFGTGEVEEAFRCLQSGKNAEKVVADVEGGGDGELTGAVVPRGGSSKGMGGMSLPGAWVPWAGLLRSGWRRRGLGTWFCCHGPELRQQRRWPSLNVCRAKGLPSTPPSVMLPTENRSVRFWIAVRLTCHPSKAVSR